MKNTARLIFLISTLFISLTWLQGTIAQAASEHTDGACMKIMEACKSAGYNKSILSENKSLSKNCMQPLLNNEKIEGVSIDPKDLESCIAKKNEIKSGK